MILYFYGEDTYRSREYLQHSIAQFKKQRDPGGYNTLLVDAKKAPMGKLFAEINTAPFLGEKRMVILENLLSSSDKETLGEFILRLKEKKIPESTVLVVWQGEALSKVKEAKQLHEVLSLEKYAREFAKLAGVKLVEWIVAKVKESGGAIERVAAEALAMNGDTWQIATAVNQLVAFASGRNITAADVAEFSEEKIDDNVFNLVDAVVSGDHKRALAMLEDARRRGEEDGHMFGLFLWQFRILTQMSDLLEREEHLTSEELARRLTIHPFVARKNLAIAKKYSLSRLEAIYRQMLELDMKTKTGQADQSLLLDLFVAKV
jgi:DNA polymerase-3 subunit delta